MELWDIYDKDRTRTEKTMERGGAFGDDSYHLVIAGCLFNSEDKMLIQQRQPFKDGWPNMWDITIGGSALAGESSHIAAERELFEEIGYAADLANERPYLTINFDTGFSDFYIINDDINIEDLTLQYEEVKTVKWAGKEEIMQLIYDDKFIPYHMSLIGMIFDMRHYRGAHSRE